MSACTLQAALPAEEPQTDAAHPQHCVSAYVRAVSARGHQPLPTDVTGTL